MTVVPNIRNNNMGLFYGQKSLWFPITSFAPHKDESCRITIVPEQLSEDPQEVLMNQGCPIFYVLFPIKNCGTYNTESFKSNINNNILCFSSENPPLFIELHDFIGEILSFSENLLQIYNSTLYNQMTSYFSDNNVYMFTIESNNSRSFLYDILEDIKIELNTNNEMDCHVEYITSLLSLFFISLVRASECKINLDLNYNKESYITYKSFMKSVELEFMTKHLVNQYATDLNISLNTLHLHIHEHSNLSPSTIIHNRIILEAKKLLLFSTKSAQEVGYILGFEDPSHFSKFFKRYVGVSPRIFKKAMEEKHP